ncbi:uncharacterized membrane protein YcaP (DUF421 family) [Bacillus sp. SORGH_AS 510]|nr:uncharacterized membrane protein YcaP (DUF421 family) [Bacillus sp. SORGH_AS_0510]
METLIIPMLRTGFAYLLLLAVSIWIGKQVNSHNNHYNFALSITLGSFIANMGFDTYLKLIPMFASFIVLIIMYFFTSLLASKSRRFRLWLSGEPTVIIENGKLLDVNMKKIRYSLDDLNQQLREQGIFDIVEVEFALLEVSGKLSVLKKSKYQNVTKNEVVPAIQKNEVHIPIELVMDGKIVEKNFTTKYSSAWLKKELESQNLQLKDVQYAVILTNGTLFIDLYNDHLNSPLDVE